MTSGNESDNLVVFHIIIPALCIPIGVVDVLANGLLLVVYIRIKFWRSAPSLAYANMLILGSISSLAATVLFAMRIEMGTHLPTVKSKSYYNLIHSLYSVEIYSMSAGLISTSAMALLRLFALKFPFAFVNIAQYRYMVPVVVSSWVLGSVVAYTQHHFWARDRYKILHYSWFVFLVTSLVIFAVAVAVLWPLHRSQDLNIKKTATKLFVLSFCYFVCYECFGAVNIIKYYVCIEKKGEYTNTSLPSQLFCNLDNFVTIIFVFPTLNSIVNAIVISRAAQIQCELQTWWSELQTWWKFNGTPLFSGRV